MFCLIWWNISDVKEAMVKFPVISSHGIGIETDRWCITIDCVISIKGKTSVRLPDSNNRGKEKVARMRVVHRR